MIGVTEEKALSALTSLLNKKKGTASEPDLLQRLAELHMRRARSGRFFELQRQTDAKAMKFVPEKFQNAQAKTSLLKALETYNDLEKRFPSFSQMDSVLIQQSDDSGAAQSKHRIRNELNQTSQPIQKLTISS